MIETRLPNFSYYVVNIQCSLPQAENAITLFDSVDSSVLPSDTAENVRANMSIYRSQVNMVLSQRKKKISTAFISNYLATQFKDADKTREI